MARFDGKVALVTGSTQGLGAAIARQFAEGGAGGIVVTGRNTERGDDRHAAQARYGTDPRARVNLRAPFFLIRAVVDFDQSVMGAGRQPLLEPDDVP